MAEKDQTSSTGTPSGKVEAGSKAPKDNPGADVSRGGSHTSTASKTGGKIKDNSNEHHEPNGR